MHQSIRVLKENYEFTRFDLDENVTFTFSLEKLDFIRFRSKKRRNPSPLSSPVQSTKGEKKKEGGRIEACPSEIAKIESLSAISSVDRWIDRSIDLSPVCLSFHFLPSNYAIIALISDNRQLSCIQRLVSAVNKQDCLFPSPSPSGLTGEKG